VDLTPRFNLLRSAVLALLPDTLRRSHPLWLAVAAVEPVKVRASRRRHLLTPSELRNIFPHRESDAIDAIVWGHGDDRHGRGRVLGPLALKADRVHVESTKRADRVRDIPLVTPPAVPRMHRRTFEDGVRARSRDLTPYDLRRTYANWLEAAGIPRTRRRLYLGHARAT